MSIDKDFALSAESGDDAASVLMNTGELVRVLGGEHASVGDAVMREDV